MAEWVIMAMIALNRDTLRADATLRSGSWELGYFRQPTIPELSEQTLGIIGFGHIGQQSLECLGLSVWRRWARCWPSLISCCWPLL